MIEGMFKVRTRFAWKPVALWRLAKKWPYSERSGTTVWLKRVREKQNMWGEWMAWEDEQVVQ